MNPSLGQRLADFRKKAGVSQKALAEAVGIIPAALSRYETDAREPNIVILMSLAKALNITVDALLGLEPHPDLIAQNGDEYALLRNFRGLNRTGRERALEYTAVLLGSPKHVDS
jgi:transcriptional regulator with XRE-family HTH domain